MIRKERFTIVANRQTTYKGVDVLKLLAAIGVVGIHVDAHYSPLIGRLAVPCFLLISGIFFFRKYDFLDEESKTRYLNSYLKAFRNAVSFLADSIFTICS
ncbi:hypothetical protein DTW93_08685 [Lactobacillus delbrueckii subsp. bulgaricus]|nr:hypothetical protein DTW93_08685 [Lactobacillus delbrueckii subsp. bulgaricus]